MNGLISLFVILFTITVVAANNSEIITINNTIYTDHVYRELYSGKYSIILNSDSKDYVLTFHTNFYELKFYNWYGKVNFIHIFKNGKLIDKCNGYCYYNNIEERKYLRHTWYDDFSNIFINIPIFNPISEYTIIVKLAEPIANNLQFDLTINDNYNNISVIFISFMAAAIDSFFIISIIFFIRCIISFILEKIKLCMCKEQQDQNIIPDKITDNNINVIDDIYDISNKIDKNNYNFDNDKTTLV